MTRTVIHSSGGARGTTGGRHGMTGSERVFGAPGSLTGRSGSLAELPVGSRVNDAGTSRRGVYGGLDGPQDGKPHRRPSPLSYP
jgi:hypothetical protein